MKRLFLLSAFALLLVLSSCTDKCGCTKSSGLTVADPASVGMSAERLSRIDTVLQEAVDENRLPGMVALVARHGKIVYHKSFGMADNESGKTMERDAIFRIASQSKAITATAVMMLWEEGRFSLDDPIYKYIPEFENPVLLESFNEKDSSYTTIPAKGQITIRQLMSHTSGIGYGAIDGDPRFSAIFSKAGIIDAFTTDSVKLEDNIKKLAKLPLHFNPGEGFYYSEGLDVMGYFIEIISGMPFDRFLRERLLDPMGMDDTWFYLPDELAPRLVSVQYREEENWKRFPYDFYDQDYPVKGAKMYFAGGAGLSSTVTDYAKLLQMYLNKGEYKGTRFLSPTTIETIMTDQTKDFWQKNGDEGYGLVFAILRESGIATGGKGSVGTFRWGGYFNTQYMGDPEEDLIVLLFKQTQGPVQDDTWNKVRIIAESAVIGE